MLNGEIRPGDNLYTCSIVSLNPDTGKLNWHYQLSPHDTHDWDAAQTPIVFDDEFNGVHRKLLAQASRNGYFFVLDRTTGEHMLTEPFIFTDWAKGIDSSGKPVFNPAKSRRQMGRWFHRDRTARQTGWRHVRSETDLFYVSARRLWSIFYMTAEGKPEGGRDVIGICGPIPSLEAIDYRTGEIRWKHEIGDGEGSAGMLTTAGKLLFTADNCQQSTGARSRIGADALAYESRRQDAERAYYL